MLIYKPVFTLFSCFASLMGFSLFAQSAVWPGPAVPHQVQAAFAQAPAVMILDKRDITYKMEESGTLVRVAAYRQVMKALTAEGVAQLNKISILQPDKAQVTAIQARTLLPNGKAYELNAKMVMEADKDGKTYKWFMVDSLQPQAELELIYQVKSNVQLFGAEVFQDSWLPVQQAVFSLSTPAELKFSVKGYNGCTVLPDSIDGDTRITRGYANALRALPEEGYSFPNQYLARIDYKLSYNQNSPARLYTWNAFAKKASQLYNTRSAAENKALEQLVTNISIPLTTGQGGQVAAIEEYVKSYIHVNHDLAPGDSSDIVQMINTKNADRQGAVRLMAGLLTQVHIPFQLVFTAKRTGIPMDEALENWERATDVLLYFPGTGRCISAVDADYRYPLMNPLLAGTKGLFVTDTVIATRKTAMGSFGFIPIDSAQYNYYNLEAEVNFNPRLDSVYIKEKQMLGGYAGADYRPVYRFQPRDKQGEMSKELLKLPGNNKVQRVQVRNYELTDAWSRKPLTISAEVYSRALVSNMGKKLVLNIGKLIGAQTAITFDSSRQLPVELDFAHTLTRNIMVRLPRGYLVKNADELNSRVQYSTANGGTVSFISSYAIKGYTLFLTVQETYSQYQYPVADYAHFNAVLNAAAAFTQNILILEKK